MSTADLPGSPDLLADALDLVHDEYTRHVVFPSLEAADAFTAYTAATHCQRLWEHATRFVVKSPVKRCGKTRLMEVARELVHSPLATGNISAAALVRLIPEDDPPTLLLDETDTVFSRKDDQAEALRSILNLGYQRGWPYHRATERGDVKTWPTFGMALLAGIGDLPDTIEDRAVVVTMQRRAPGESVAAFRQRDAAGLHSIRTTLEHAIKLTLGRYDSYDPPDMPVEDRAADVWEPLMAVAETAGRDWPDRIRKACLLLSNADEDDFSLSVKLLTDLEAVWGDEEHLATATILERLHALDESPWPDYFGRPLNPRDLARLLRPYQVKPKAVRIGGSTPRGYSRADVHPVWTRYVLPPGEAQHAQQAQHRDTSDTNSPPLSRDVADVADVADSQGVGGSVPPQSDTEATQDAVEMLTPFDIETEEIAP